MYLDPPSEPRNVRIVLTLSSTSVTFRTKLYLYKLKLNCMLLEPSTCTILSPLKLLGRSDRISDIIADHCCMHDLDLVKRHVASSYLLQLHSCTNVVRKIIFSTGSIQWSWRGQLVCMLGSMIK